MPTPTVVSVLIGLSCVLRGYVASYAFRGPTDVISTRGKRVTLSCSTNNPKAIGQMSWSVGDDTRDVIYSGKRIRDDVVDRYEVIDDKNGTVTLVILRAEDAASFICKDISSRGHDRGRAFVTIVDDSLPELERTFIASNMVEQRCTFKFRGWHEPTIQWIDQNGKVVAVSKTDKYNVSESVESVIRFPTSAHKERHYGCRVTFILSNGSRVTFNNSAYKNKTLDSGNDKQSLFHNYQHSPIFVPVVVVAAVGGVFLIWAVAVTVMCIRLWCRNRHLQYKSDLAGPTGQQIEVHSAHGLRPATVDHKCACLALNALINFVLCRLLPARSKCLRDSEYRYDRDRYPDAISLTNT